MGRLKKFPVELVPNMRTYIVRLAALAVSAEHPLSNGKKMEIFKTKTLLKIPTLRSSRFASEKHITNSKKFSAPKNNPRPYLSCSVAFNAFI